MADVLFHITCTTCEARLSVRDRSAIGAIVNCPKCGGMVQVVPPQGWQDPPEQPAQPEEPAPSTGRPTTEKPSRAPAKPSAPKKPAANKPAANKTQAKQAPKSPPSEQRTKPAGNQPKAEKPTPTASPKKPAQSPPRPQKKRSQAKNVGAATAAGVAAAVPASGAEKAPTPAGPPDPSPAVESPSFEVPDAPPVQPPAEMAPAEPVSTPPVTQFVNPAEVAMRRWLLWGAAPVAGVVMLIGALSLFSGGEPTPDPVENPQVPVATVIQDGQTQVPFASIPVLDDRWIPDSPQLVLSLDVAGAQAAGQLVPLFETIPALRQVIVDQLFEGFGLTPEAVDRLCWCSTDLADWSGTGVVAFNLAEGQSTAPLRSVGDSVNWQLEGIEVRHLKRPTWSRTFVVLDDRTILTAEETILRQLAERGKRAADLGVLRPLLTDAPVNADLCVAVDLKAVTQAGWPLPSEWLNVWPQGRDAWRVIWGMPAAMSFSFDDDDLALAELGLLCDAKTVADNVRVALEQWIPQAESALAARIQSLPASVQAGEIPAAAASSYRLALNGAAEALASTHLEVAGSCVWLRADFGTNSSAWTAAAAASRPVMREDWDRATRAADGTVKGRNEQALTGGTDADEKTPSGAGNAGPAVSEQPAMAAGSQPAPATEPPGQQVVRIEPTTSPPAETNPKPGQTPVLSPQEPTAQTPAEDEVAIAERLRVPLPGISMTNIPLYKAVRAIEDYGSLLVTFDVDTMSAMDLALDQPVSEQEIDVNVGEALQVALSSCGLKAVMHDNQLWVTGSAQAFDGPRVVRYSVNDLTSADGTPVAEFASQISRLIAPETWQANGGPGTIDVESGALKITQRGTVQLQVLVFCERLRVARGLPTRSGRPARYFPLATRRTRAVSNLQQPVSVNFFRPTALRRVVQEIDNQCEALITVNWLALAEEGKSPALPTTVSVAQVPLSQVLDQTLEPLGLDFRAIDERTIEVTTRAAADAHFEREFYPIRSLLTAGNTVAALIEQVRAQVNAATWQSNGGKGALQFDEPSQCLIVLQTQRGHVAIEQYLEGLRAGAKKN